MVVVAMSWFNDGRVEYTCERLVNNDNGGGGGGGRGRRGRR
jgi:hypothetical protein